MAGPYSYQTGRRPTLHIADYVVFAATLGISALIGLFYAIKDRNRNNTEEFLLGGRKMGVIPVTLSLLSSFISAVTLLGTPAEIYTYNTMFWWISIAFLVTSIGTAFIFIPIFYNLGITSTFEYVQLRFGPVVRLVSSLIYIAWMLLFMAIVLYGPSLALNAVTGLSLWGSIVAVSLVCTFYTTLGGMKAVLWTDTLQCCVMLAGMFCLIIQGSILVGGFDKVWEIAERHNRIVFTVFDPDPSVRHSVWNVVIGGGFMWATIYGINQAQVQRAISVPTLKKARLAVFLNIPGMFLIQTLACTTGVVMFAFYHTCDPVSFGLVNKGDQLIPLFMLDILGDITGLSGLLLSCIFSGSLSTISSGLNAMSAVMIKDFITPFCCPKINEFWATILSKAMVVLFGFVALLLAFVVSTMGAILQATYLLFGFLGGPILGIFTLGMLFPWTNKWGALVGELTSLAILMWIGLGNFINKVATSNPSRVLTDGCNWNLTHTDTVWNTTEMTSGYTPIVTDYSASSIAESDEDPLTRLYSLSYMWYTPLAVLITVVVGLIVSFITGATEPSHIDPRLICPVFDIFFPCLPERIRKRLRFGVRHDEVLDLSKAEANIEMEISVKEKTTLENDIKSTENENTHM